MSFSSLIDSILAVSGINSELKQVLSRLGARLMPNGDMGHGGMVTSSQEVVGSGPPVKVTESRRWRLQPVCTCAPYLYPSHTYILPTYSIVIGSFFFFLP